MTRRRGPRDDRDDQTEDVLEVLEHIRYIEKVRADTRAIERETAQLDRDLRRSLRRWACAVPALTGAGIALLLLTDAYVLSLIVLLNTAFLAAAIWMIERLRRRQADDAGAEAPDTDDADDGDHPAS